MARFGTHTVGSQVLVLPKDLKFTPAPIAGQLHRRARVYAKLNKIRVEPSGICSDEEFLRRVSIDIVGLLPTAGEYQAFVADSVPDKRAKLVDRLLARKEFSEIWAMKWAELLMIKIEQRRELQGHAALLQLADRQDRQQRAAGPDGARAAFAPAAARSRTRRRTTTRSSATRSRSPRTWPRCSWASASSAASATTIRSTAGR